MFPFTGSAVVRHDLPPPSRTNAKAVKSANQENDGPEEEQIHRGVDHWRTQADRSRHAGQGALQRLQSLAGSNSAP